MQRKVNYFIFILIFSFVFFCNYIFAQNGKKIKKGPNINVHVNKKQGDKTKIFNADDPSKTKGFPGFTNPNEDAIAEQKTHVNVSVPNNLRVNYTENKDKTITATVEVPSITVKIEYWTIIWLPDKGATKKLKGHEKGHATLSDFFYNRFAKPLAKAAAKKAAKKKKISAKGATKKKATQTLQKKLTNYVTKIKNKVVIDLKVAQYYTQHYYDLLTKHGTNKMKESDAIKKSLERTEKKYFKKEKKEKKAKKKKEEKKGKKGDKENSEEEGAPVSEEEGLIATY